MILKPAPDGYIIEYNGIDYPLAWVSNADMDDLGECEFAGLPVFYSDDGRYYPVPIEDVEVSVAYKSRVFKK